MPLPSVIRGAIRYRWLALELVVRDLRVRYRGSYIGFLWTLLNPVLFMGVYVLVFGYFLNVGTDKYPVFLLSGLIPWTWFSGAVLQGTTAINDGRVYIGKTIFPIEVLIAVPILSNMLNFVLSLPLLIMVCLAFGAHLSWSLLLLPVVVAIQFLLTLGILLILATYNVFYRDLQQLSGLFVTFLFFLNPIFYPVERIPTALRPYAMADPITPLISAYRSMFFDGSWPSLVALGYAALAAIIIYILGRLAFERHRDTFAEYL